MSSNESDQGGAGRREVAWRVFAAEYDDASLDYSESDEERAPNYVVTPTGARINRLFVVGVLTQVEQVSDDVLRARIVDPTGAFVVYAGQYQPDEMAFLESASPPAFVAVTGKARTFQPDDSDRVFTSVRPESISRVDADTRDRWVVQTAEQTLDRVSTFADALESDARGDDLRAALEAGGADAGLASGIPLAIDHYGTTKAYLAAVRDAAIDTARVVSGELDADEVGPLDLAPDEGGEVDADFEYSLSDAEPTEIAEIESSDETATEAETPEAETPPAESRTEVGETDAASEGSSEPEPTESVGESDASASAEASEPSASDDLGEAPTSTVDADAEARTETEPDASEVEDAEDAAELQGEIGTDEPPTVEDDQETTADEAVEPETDDGDDGPDIGTAGAGDEMYEMDDDERQETIEEHGLEFSSGTDVSDPGEADIETPDAETLQDVESAQGGTEDGVGTDEQAPAGGESAAGEAPGAEIGEEETADLEPEPEDETADSEGSDAEPEGEAGDNPEPDNLENTVMNTMQDLNDGDGVERETLLAAVVQNYDVTPADVDDALEAALMAGRCYESGEDTLKPI
ncbi:hypothetical protein [Halorussus amylolyticus]|uniref:hypothetical protein n=1 Tax=Halorussus amylolyticus TaxID=1126242 RepID=UPI00104ED87C|nr:hypothetical protein [Halorussus amylolyticus]